MVWFLSFIPFFIFAERPERFFQYPIYKISSSIKLNRQIIQILHLLSKYKFHILYKQSNICAAAAHFLRTLGLEVFLTQQSFKLVRCELTLKVLEENFCELC